ncbi:pentapeptide repeat-containing protein [Achromobacter animicus]|uniref:pentapeptide repeat-containing protein n=1 Tax=Achromobacter animicus TaxID=1389935 RepID=UPI003CCDFD8A
MSCAALSPLAGRPVRRVRAGSLRYGKPGGGRCARVWGVSCRTAARAAWRVRRANPYRASLPRALFPWPIRQPAPLGQANLRQANLRQANLRQAILRQATLRQATLRRALPP